MRPSATALWLVASVLALTLLVGCGGGGGQQAEQQQDQQQERQVAEPVTGEFVGKASGQDAHVAVVAMKGDSEGQTEVIGYICNGTGGLAEWFQGLATGNAVDLKSKDGDAHLRATLKEGGPEGTIELPGGTTVTFTATSSAGLNPAGLWEVTLYPDGRYVGSSWGDKRLEVQSTHNRGAEGRLILPDERSLPLEYPANAGTTATTAGQLRAVILPDGASRGSKTKSTGSTQTSFWDPYLMD